VFGHPPVLLLDDVFSDLDFSRRARLMEFALAEGGQVFLTCTEAELAGEELARRSQVFLVQSGAVTPQ
jgi:DNA replication and repair protein RecF